MVGRPLRGHRQVVWYNRGMTDLPCTVTSQELDHYEEHQQAGCATCERAVAYLNEIAEPDAIITL